MKHTKNVGNVTADALLFFFGGPKDYELITISLADRKIYFSR